MYRRMMVQNRICEKKDMERKKRSYRRRLKRVTKSVDNEVPYSYRNVKKGVKRRNLKKEQMQEERFTAIERDNRMLLEKMSWIMQHNSIDMHNTSRQFCKSLNYPHRVARLKKINQKNKVMLQRIQKTNTLREALEKAKEKNKNVVIYFYSSSKDICEGQCKKASIWFAELSKKFKRNW